MRPSKECNQSWGINWRHNERSRQPPPRCSDEHPPAIMKRAKAPWFVFQPGPAPGVNPHPATETVWYPAGWNNRIPDGSILSDHRPVPVGIQILVPRSGRAHVFCVGRRCKTLVAFLAPNVEVVQRRHGDRIDLDWILTREFDSLTGL